MDKEASLCCWEVILCVTGYRESGASAPAVSRAVPGGTVKESGRKFPDREERKGTRQRFQLCR